MAHTSLFQAVKAANGWTLLTAMTLSVAATSYAMWQLSQGQQSEWIANGGLLGLLLSAIFGYRILRNSVRQKQSQMQLVEKWAHGMGHGEMQIDLPELKDPDFENLTRNINIIGDQLRELTWDMESAVNKETERLADKTRSLQVLYDVAASVNMARDMDDLLTCFLHTLIELVHAEAATVRLLSGEGHMRLVASNGFDTEVIAAERVIPDSQRGLCGAAILDGSTRRAYHAEPTGQIDQEAPEAHAMYIPFVDDDSVEMLTVPLKYRDKTLGVYNLFIHKDKMIQEGTMELLTSIGQHLGMAIEKNRLDDEATRLSLIEERGRLANELHDSLAQTLASMKFQTSMVDDSLSQGDDNAVRKELKKLKNSLAEAYTELRELIAHFRAPVEEHGLIPGLQALINRFKRQTDITIFFQHHGNDIDLPIEVEMQAMRIVQESLANIRKHAHARTVRVMVRCTDDRHYSILIEDDGVGFGTPTLDGKPGEHIGLSIMKERAQRIGGTLDIESEPGEGTQVTLDFDYPQRAQPELKLNNG